MGKKRGFPNIAQKASSTTRKKFKETLFDFWWKDQQVKKDKNEKKLVIFKAMRD